MYALYAALYVCFIRMHAIGTYESGHNSVCMYACNIRMNYTYVSSSWRVYLNIQYMCTYTCLQLVFLRTPCRHVHIRMYTYAYIYIYACIRMHTYTCLQLVLRAPQTCVNTYIHAYTRTYTYAYICVPAVGASRALETP